MQKFSVASVTRQLNPVRQENSFFWKRFEKIKKKLFFIVLLNSTGSLFRSQLILLPLFSYLINIPTSKLEISDGNWQLRLRNDQWRRVIWRDSELGWFWFWLGIGVIRQWVTAGIPPLFIPWAFPLFPCDPMIDRCILPRHFPLFHPKTHQYQYKQ